MKTLNLIILFLLLWIAPALCQSTVITGKIDVKAEAVAIRPDSPSSTPSYYYTNVNADGSFTLSMPLDVPMVCELVFFKEGRSELKTTIFLKPGKEIRYFNEAGNARYECDYAKENEIARAIYRKMYITYLQKLTISDSEIKELEQTLSTDGITKDFVSLMKELIYIQRDLQQLNLRKDDKSETRKTITRLLKTTDNSSAWLSLYNWQGQLDSFLIQAEYEKLLKKKDVDLINRVEWIKVDYLRERYALYSLYTYVLSRRWFNGNPEKTIAAVEPYIKRNNSKLEFEGTKNRFDRYNKAWEPLRNAPAPDFTFEDVNGKMVSLKDFRGKFVLLDSWNIYCGPCIEQVPFLKQMKNDFKQLNVEVVGVSCDPQDIKDKWRSTVKAKNMEGHQLIMDNGRDSRYLTDYSIYGFPTFTLIGPDGWVINPFFYEPENPKFLEKLKEAVKNWKPRK